MAWQLIYTSAPKLLEAGRTGFGTVARHRSVSGLLATSVERLSQFARLPGHDPKRVVYCHRIVNVGGSDYHVLSCLRDAGSDYTGRTNHIAHHLVAESREIASLIDAGITPGDVLRAMPWRSEWTESARYFDAAEEINLGALKSSKRDAWRSLSGNAEHARLPWADTAARGCYFVTPPELDLLPLISESLDEKIAAAWQTTFTTNLEPNDDVADFKWIGLPVASPLRSMAEASARPLFDLSSPATLPPPPARPAAPVEVAPAPSAVTSATTPAFTIPAPSLAPVRSGTTFSPGNNRRKTIDLGQSWAPEAKKEKPTGRMPVVAAVVLGLMAIGGIYVGSSHLEAKQKQKKAEIEYKDKVAKVFAGWNLPEIESEIRGWKTEQRTENLETIGQILKSIEEPANGEVAGLFGNGGNLLRESSNPYDVFVKAAEAWIKASKETGGPLAPKNLSNLETALQAWQNAQDALVSLNTFRSADNNLLPSATFPKALYKAAMELLATDTLSETDQKPTAWKTLVEGLQLSDTERKDEAPWIKTWFESADQPKILANLDVTQVPKWISAKVEKTKAANPAEETKTTEGVASAVDNKNSGTPPLDPDSADANHDISIVVIPAVNDGGNEPGEPELVVDEKLPSQISIEMKLFVWGGNVQKGKAEEWSYNKRLSENEAGSFVFTKGKKLEKKDAFIFSSNSITQIPLTFAKGGCRLVGFSVEQAEKNILFDMRVVKPGNQEPIFPDTIEYILNLNDWVLPQLPQEAHTADLKACKPKLYRLEIKPDQQKLARRLASVFQKRCTLDIINTNATMPWSNNTITVGSDEVKKINDTHGKLVQNEATIVSLNDEKKETLKSKTYSPNVREAKIKDLDKQLVEAHANKAANTAALKMLMKELQDKEPFIGIGILGFEKTQIVKIKLTLPQQK